MALQKDITQKDGVITSYHRILYLHSTINRCNSIAVISYVNAEARESEKAGTIKQAYQKAVTYETNYSPNMTAETAYEYLKTLPQFEGAVDV